MSEASQEIVPQSTEVTQASEASPPPTEVVTKKTRTPAQVAALDAARQKALAMRAQKKTQPAEESTKPGAAEEGEQEVEYVRKSKSKTETQKTYRDRGREFRGGGDRGPTSQAQEGVGSRTGA